MSLSVHELREKCFDENIPVSSLLRMGLNVARKHGLQEFKEWALLELNGYDENNLEDLPDYRTVLGKIVAFSNRIIPAQHNPKELRPLRKVTFVDKIDIIEYCFKHDKSKYFTYSEQLQQELQRIYNTNHVFHIKVGKLEYHSIIDNVKYKMFELVSSLKTLDEDVLVASRKEDRSHMKINIQDSNIGILSTSDIAQSTLNVEISTAPDNSQREVIAALEAIKDAITTSQEIEQEQHAEISEMVEWLKDQAKLPTHQRKRSIIKPVLTGLPAALNAVGGAAKIWDAWGDEIMRFFGLGG